MGSQRVPPGMDTFDWKTCTVQFPSSRAAFPPNGLLQAGILPAGAMPSQRRAPLGGGKLLGEHSIEGKWYLRRERSFFKRADSFAHLRSRSSHTRVASLSFFAPPADRYVE